MTQALADHIYRSYAPAEFPALATQIASWQTLMPLKGLRILDATPVFRNTLVKYYSLLSAGAEVTVSVGRDIPCDPQIVQMLPDFGIRVADSEKLKENYDLVADCAGRHCHVYASAGYVELTRSGLEYYRDFPRPVYSADSGILKLVETSLGTADGFIRAMKQLGHGDFRGRKTVIFGGGKVGGGMAMFLTANGAEVCIADRDPGVTVPAGCRLLHTENREKVKQAIDDAWCVIAATGLPDALAYFAADLNKSGALIVNMGVEDEFSSALPASRVLNKKTPLNFILDEPTRLRFIDPVMALNNALLCDLAQNHHTFSGIALPPEDLETAILQQVISAGEIPAELMEYVIRNRKDRQI